MYSITTIYKIASVFIILLFELYVVLSEIYVVLSELYVVLFELYVVVYVLSCITCIYNYFIVRTLRYIV